LLGLLVATSAMGALSGESAASAGATALLLVGVAILDTALVMVSRRRRGIRLLLGGRDHLTHRLHAQLGSARRVAALVGLVQIALAGVALAAWELGADVAVAAGALYGVAAIAAIRALEAQAEALPVPSGAGATEAAPPAVSDGQLGWQPGGPSMRTSSALQMQAHDSDAERSMR
jgi:UDP-GlcNAc:undecaprenyl-phosphate GlcNAc-1-phosphate transferase